MLQAMPQTAPWTVPDYQQPVPPDSEHEQYSVVIFLIVTVFFEHVP